MNKEDKKMAVFTALEAFEEPVSLQHLLQVLGDDFSERSVRRWLSNMAGEGLLEKLGHKRATRYRTLDLDISTQQSTFTFSHESEQSIVYIRSPIFERDPVTYHKDWLAEYLPNKTFYLNSQEREKLLAKGQRSFNHDVAGTYARKIYNRLLIDLSYNSARLEGNTYSLIDTEKLLIDGVSQESKLDEEKVMIINHKEAIRHLVEGIDRINIDPIEVGTIHYLLSDGLIDAHYAGKPRDHGVRISESTYVPLESKEQLKQQLETLTSKASKIQNPYEQSFFLLVHLAYLQAFSDVNKRTSRLSSNIPLLKNNLVPLSFNDIDKHDYASAMIAIYELNDVRPLAELYVFSYLRTCKVYDVNIESLGFDEVRVRYRQQRREMIREIVQQLLLGSQLDAYIKEKTTAFIPADERLAFIEDLQEDLQGLCLQTIAGLGVSAEELQRWQKKFASL